MIVHDCEQGSPEWHALRCGIVTCSELSSVLAKGQGKTRRTYMLKVLGERLTGTTTDSYSNHHMERGIEQEPEARELYQFLTDAEVIQVGIIINHDVGYSPDGLVGDDGSIEIKSKLPHIHLEALLSDKVPPEHMTQIQGGLWVSERKWCDFISYCPGIKPFIRRVFRDEKKIAEIEMAVGAFCLELDSLQEQAA